MGQAKLRGNLSDRIVKARSKLESMRPEKLVCNNCQTEFTEFELLDTKIVPGVDAIFAGKCPGCNRITMAGIGDPEVVAMYLSAFSEYTGGGEGMAGIQKL